MQKEQRHKPEDQNFSKSLQNNNLLQDQSSPVVRNNPYDSFRNKYFPQEHQAALSVENGILYLFPKRQISDFSCELHLLKDKKVDVPCCSSDLRDDQAGATNEQQFFSKEQSSLQNSEFVLKMDRLVQDDKHRVSKSDQPLQRDNTFLKDKKINLADDNEYSDSGSCYCPEKRKFLQHSHRAVSGSPQAAPNKISSGVGSTNDRKSECSGYTENRKPALTPDQPLNNPHPTYVKFSANPQQDFAPTGKPKYKSDDKKELASSSIFPGDTRIKSEKPIYNIPEVKKFPSFYCNQMSASKDQREQQHGKMTSSKKQQDLPEKRSSLPKPQPYHSNDRSSSLGEYSPFRASKAEVSDDRAMLSQVKSAKPNVNTSLPKDRTRSPKNVSDFAEDKSFPQPRSDLSHDQAALSQHRKSKQRIQPTSLGKKGKPVSNYNPFVDDKSQLNLHSDLPRDHATLLQDSTANQILQPSLFEKQLITPTHHNPFVDGSNVSSDENSLPKNQRDTQQPENGTTVKQGHEQMCSTCFGKNTSSLRVPENDGRNISLSRQPTESVRIPPYSGFGPLMDNSVLRGHKTISSETQHDDKISKQKPESVLTETQHHEQILINSHQRESSYLQVLENDSGYISDCMQTTTSPIIQPPSTDNGLPEDNRMSPNNGPDDKAGIQKQENSLTEIHVRQQVSNSSVQGKTSCLRMPENESKNISYSRQQETCVPPQSIESPQSTQSPQSVSLKSTTSPQSVQPQSTQSPQSLPLQSAPPHSVKPQSTQSPQSLPPQSTPPHSMPPQSVPPRSAQSPQSAPPQSTETPRSVSPQSTHGSPTVNSGIPGNKLKPSKYRQDDKAAKEKQENNLPEMHAQEQAFSNSFRRNTSCLQVPESDSRHISNSKHAAWSSHIPLATTSANDKPMFPITQRDDEMVKKKQKSSSANNQIYESTANTSLRNDISCLPVSENEGQGIPLDNQSTLPTGKIKLQVNSRGPANATRYSSSEQCAYCADKSIELKVLKSMMEAHKLAHQKTSLPTCSHSAASDSSCTHDASGSHDVRHYRNSRPKLVLTPSGRHLIQECVPSISRHFLDNQFNFANDNGLDKENIPSLTDVGSSESKNVIMKYRSNLYDFKDLQITHRRYSKNKSTITSKIGQNNLRDEQFLEKNDTQELPNTKRNNASSDVKHTPVKAQSDFHVEKRAVNSCTSHDLPPLHTFSKTIPIREDHYPPRVFSTGRSNLPECIASFQMIRPIYSSNASRKSKNEQPDFSRSLLHTLFDFATDTSELQNDEHLSQSDKQPKVIYPTVTVNTTEYLNNLRRLEQPNRANPNDISGYADVTPGIASGTHSVRKKQHPSSSSEDRSDIQAAVLMPEYSWLQEHLLHLSSFSDLFLGRSDYLPDSHHSPSSTSLSEDSAASLLLKYFPDVLNNYLRLKDMFLDEEDDQNLLNEHTEQYFSAIDDGISEDDDTSDYIPYFSKGKFSWQRPGPFPSRLNFSSQCSESYLTEVGTSTHSNGAELSNQVLDHDIAFTGDQDVPEDLLYYAKGIFNRQQPNHRFSHQKSSVKNQASILAVNQASAPFDASNTLNENDNPRTNYVFGRDVHVMYKCYCSKSISRTNANESGSCSSEHILLPNSLLHFHGSKIASDPKLNLPYSKLALEEHQTDSRIRTAISKKPISKDTSLLKQRTPGGPNFDHISRPEGAGLKLDLTETRSEPFNPNVSLLQGGNSATFVYPVSSSSLQKGLTDSEESCENILFQRFSDESQLTEGENDELDETVRLGEEYILSSGHFVFANDILSRSYFQRLFGGVLFRDYLLNPPLGKRTALHSQSRNLHDGDLDQLNDGNLPHATTMLHSDDASEENPLKFQEEIPMQQNVPNLLQDEKVAKSPEEKSKSFRNEDLDLQDGDGCLMKDQPILCTGKKWMPRKSSPGIDGRILSSKLQAELLEGNFSSYASLHESCHYCVPEIPQKATEQEISGSLLSEQSSFVRQYDINASDNKELPPFTDEDADPPQCSSDVPNDSPLMKYEQDAPDKHFLPTYCTELPSSSSSMITKYEPGLANDTGWFLNYKHKLSRNKR